MPHSVQMAFQPEGMMLGANQLLPLRKLPAGIRTSEKYKRIAASVKEIGLIEPLVVFPQQGVKDRYLLLDGHIRLDVLTCQGHAKVFCLIATEDEAYTYNHKVSQLTPIQEHFMIMKAVQNGVSEERIAATLNVDVASIRRKQNLLAGICPEAVALLKDRRVSAGALREVKRVGPLRQMEMAELMRASNNFSVSYAKCLYIATPDDQRVEVEEPDNEQSFSPEDRVRMEREMQDLLRNFKTIEETYNDNVMHLMLSVAYVKALLNGPRGAFLVPALRRHPG